MSQKRITELRKLIVARKGMAKRARNTRDLLLDKIDRCETEIRLAQRELSTLTFKVKP